MTEDAGGQNLTVAVRLRPLNKREEQKKVAKVVRSSQHRVVVSAGARGGPDRTYAYDKVFSPYATQEHVFDSLVSPVVDEVLAGFNCTVFAYGPTGTGKTHTMEGSLEEPAEMGLIPRCARALYERRGFEAIEEDSLASACAAAVAREIEGSDEAQILMRLPGTGKKPKSAKKRKRSKGFSRKR